MNSTSATAHPRTASRLRLWAEFLVLFFGIPLGLAFLIGRFPLFPVLIGLALLACGLLALTPGFRFRLLLKGPVLREWPIILGFGVVTGTICTATALWLVPERFLGLPLYWTERWVLIMLLYPIVSVIPQEIIYRTLFFERYGTLFSTKTLAITVNGIAFGLGHFFFLNWLTISMTAVGGLVMGWAYLRHRSFILACILHSLAGQIIFTTGLGLFFYHGAIGVR